MVAPEDQIPREIIESERNHALPPKPERPGILGLPPIPDDLLAVFVKYLPWIVLSGAILNGFGAAGVLMTISSASYGVTGPATAFGAVFSLLASLAGAFAFIWLMDKREIGWYMLAFALFLQFLSGLIVSGGRSILGGIISLVITIYVMLQLRDSYVE